MEKVLPQPPSLHNFHEKNSVPYCIDSLSVIVMSGAALMSPTVYSSIFAAGIPKESAISWMIWIVGLRTPRSMPLI